MNQKLETIKQIDTFIKGPKFEKEIVELIKDRILKTKNSG